MKKLAIAFLLGLVTHEIVDLALETWQEIERQRTIRKALGE